MIVLQIYANYNALLRKKSNGQHYLLSIRGGILCWSLWSCFASRTSASNPVPSSTQSSASSARFSRKQSNLLFKGFVNLKHWLTWLLLQIYRPVSPNNLVFKDPEKVERKKKEEKREKEAESEKKRMGQLLLFSSSSSQSKEKTVPSIRKERFSTWSAQNKII